MALIRRLSRLFTADMHAVLDQIEEPGIVLRQAIREMEEELARQRQRRKWLQAEIESAAGRNEGFADLFRDLDAKLDVCFANDNDALARRLTRRKLEVEQLAEQTETKQRALGKQLDELDNLIAANADELDSMKQKAALLATEEAGTAAGRRGQAAGIDDDDVEIAFLREKQARAAS